MKRKTISIIIVVGLLVSVGAVFAFAHGARWHGRGDWGRDDWGYHHRGYFGSGYDNPMSAEQYKAFGLQREAFIKETEALRAKLFDKTRELQRELDKDDPDVSKAAALQKEVSDFQAQLDQKRIEHMIAIRKIAPDQERGYARGGPMMGYGPQGGGPYMGYGPGGGYCWR